MLAQRAARGAAPLRAPLKEAKDAEWAHQYLADLREACGLMHMPEGVEDAIAHGADEAYFSQHLSRCLLYTSDAADE
mgnify:CR=1 FL=1